MTQSTASGFATGINCMDGRVQLPLVNHMMSTYNVSFVDQITEAGPVRYFNMPEDATQTDRDIFTNMLARIDISVHHHGSKVINVTAHPDCAGNVVEDDKQKIQLLEAKAYLKEKYPTCTVEAVWIWPANGEDWSNVTCITL
ncbi:hypothetical protein KIPB_008552 [Kipferlia bialata]|uniref:Uncharacterized protein n=1 Tax=Kipferlia bialata TaxID=797122 RepID=A0A9K3D3J6_9EUKA|nr:hypothetical protein KIPB_008552 [Kipferlia bialata]|eukprot:g8552.t1